MIEVAAALSAATTAFNAIKKGFEVGRDIESMSGDLSRWMGSVSDINKADEYAKKYPDQFIIVDSIKFFDDHEYSTNVLGKVGLNINQSLLPVDLTSCDITTSLHGGIGNNLLQMAEVISFCKKNNLVEPFFGTWDLWDGGGKYPPPYNADRFLGGHD